MKTVRSLDLTRAVGFGRLPELFVSRAGESGLVRAFETVGLPLAVLDARETPVPYHAVIDLFERCARVLGDRTLGLEVGHGMAGGGFGLWGQYGLAAATLGEAIQRLNASSWAHHVGARLVLARDRQYWFWRSLSHAADRGQRNTAIISCRR